VAVTPGTIAPLVSQPINRQTIPYGDRPIVTVRSGGAGGFATREFYQWLIRVNQGVAATIENVDSVITVVNTISVNLGSVEAQIGTIEAEIAEIFQDLTAVGGASVPALPPLNAFVLAQDSIVEADCRAVTYWGL
jgi:hypothetical protein